MEPATDEEHLPGRHVALRIIGALAVMAIAVLAVLMVFDFIDMTTFKDLIIKTGMLALIFAGASMLLGLLGGRSG